MKGHDELLERARSGMTPGAEQKDRMRTRLLAGLGVAGAASAAGTAAASAAGASGWTAKVVAVLFAASAVVGVAYVARPAPEAPRVAETVVETTPDEPVVATSAPPEPAVEIEEPAPVADETMPDEPLHAVARRERPAPPVVVEDDLEAESALVRRARAALRDGDARAALAALDEHGRRFPGGTLAEERDVQRVRAFCAAGDTARAERAARAFVEAHPGSVHAAHMATPCD